VFWAAEPPKTPKFLVIFLGVSAPETLRGEGENAGKKDVLDGCAAQHIHFSGFHPRQKGERDRLPDPEPFSRWEKGVICERGNAGPCKGDYNATQTSEFLENSGVCMRLIPQLRI
jgi:hypothetical protein